MLGASNHVFDVGARMLLFIDGSASVRSNMEQEEYRGSVIHYEINNPNGFWNATGHGELIVNDILRSFAITGPIDKYTSRDDAKEDILKKAKEWIDRQLST